MEKQKYKTLWEKLKKIIEEDLERNHNEYKKTSMIHFINYCAEAKFIVDIMEELEKAD